jgi:spore germination protein GerM
MREIDITFKASGWVTQTVEVDDDITEQDLEELVSGLSDGRLATTIQEGGEILDEDLRRVGLVVEIDSNLKYSDFAVTNISPIL